MHGVWGLGNEGDLRSRSLVDEILKLQGAIPGPRVPKGTGVSEAEQASVQPTDPCRPFLACGERQEEVAVRVGSASL